MDVVADVYSRSTGSPGSEHEVWAFPEYGAVHLGTHAAWLCCHPDFFV